MDSQKNSINDMYNNWSSYETPSIGFVVTYPWRSNGYFRTYFKDKVYECESASSSQIINNYSYYYHKIWQGDLVQLGGIGGNYPWHMYAVSYFESGDIKLSAHTDNYIDRSLMELAYAKPDEIFHFYYIKNGY